MANQKGNSGRAPLTPEQREELLRRRNARIAAERGQRPPQPLTPEQKKRLARQRAEERERLEKEQKAREKQAKKQQKLQQKRAKQRAKAQQMQGDGRPVSSRMTHSAARRARRRRAIITAVLLLLFIIVGLTLSVTVLFPIDSYRVDGESIYSEQQLIEASGLALGENIFRFRLGEKETEMQKALPYLEQIKVRRRLPRTVVFIVEPAVEAGWIETGEGSGVLISETRRVLSLDAAPPEGILRISGFAPKDAVPGTPITSGDEGVDAMLATMMNAVRASGLSPVTAMDLTDEYELTVTYADRILIRLGTSSQLEYKLSVVEKALEQGTADGTFTDSSTGTMDASNAGTAYYRPG